MTRRCCSTRHDCFRRLEAPIPGFSRADADRHYPPDLELEPVHLAIDLRVSVAERTARGEVTTTVRARGAGPRVLRLDAVDLQVEAVEDVDGRELRWRYDGERIAAAWVDAFEPGEERRVVVRYGVSNPVTGLYFSQPDEASPTARWMAATDHETERARYWLPCVDHPSVRPRLDMRLRADARFTILANGELVGETGHDDETKTAHWRLDAPCPSYLTCFVIGELTRCDDGEVDGVPIAYFGPASFSADDLKRSFGRTDEMLAWLNEKLGTKLPYPKYFQFAAPGIGGAMENISLVSWDERFLLDETLAREMTWLLDVVNVHEMAHSWFGDWIVCRDHSHAWLKEGWATYIESCWLEHAHGDDEARYNLYSDAARYISEADDRYQRPIVTRVFDHSWDMFDMHLYPGAAWRLHMLRHLLGDETFWAAVREYVARYGGDVVETDDFRRVLESRSGRSLGRFFDEWLYSPGYPKLKVSFSHDAKAGRGTFEIAQTQAKAKAKGSRAEGQEADGDSSALMFHFELELGWVAGGEMRVETVSIEREEHVFVVAMPEAPEQVRVDPAGKLLHTLDFDPGDDLLRRQLRKAPDVVGRIQAAKALAKKGRDSHIDAIASAYRSERFWGVRVELGRALAAAGTDRAVGAVATLIGEEADPMVMEQLFRAAGGLRDERVRTALLVRLDGELPYRARAAALESLGKQRTSAPVDRLVVESKGASLHGLVQYGALYGLAESRHRRGWERLLEACQKGGVYHPEARIIAVNALGRVGGLLERADRERVVERLVDLLRDPGERLRAAAVLALVAIQASEATDALRAYADRAPDHQTASIRRALGKLRRGEQPRSAAVEKQVESLEDRLRELNGIVRRLEARVGGDEHTDGDKKRRTAKKKNKGGKKGD